MQAEFVERYDVPEWARNIAVQPTCRTNLTMKPTPIHRWNLPDLPPEFNVSVKRDDLTGSICSGNKIRKLDFCFGDALAKGCDTIITAGSTRSNHARTTAAAARQLGLEAHLVLFSPTHIQDIQCKGNYFLDRIMGAKVYLFPDDSIKLLKGGVTDIFEDLKVKLRAEGRTPYVIPIGASSLLGTWGYIEAWQELINQGVLDNFDDIVMVCGTSGSVCGLAIGNYLTGSKLRIHGITVGRYQDEIHQWIQDHLKHYNIQVDAKDLLNVVDRHVGKGYAEYTQEDLSFAIKVMSHTGVTLDPVYTGKAVKGMLTEMRERPHIFKGRRILFVHTGGLFGLFQAGMEDIVDKSTACNMKDISDFLPHTPNSPS